MLNAALAPLGAASRTYRAVLGPGRGQKVLRLQALVGMLATNSRVPSWSDRN